MVALDVAIVEHSAFDEGVVDREQVLTRYRRLRALARDHNSAVLERVPRKALLAWGKRLGMVRRKSFVTQMPEELALAFDLAVYAPLAGRMAPVERHRRLARLPPDSDEARVLDAMCRSRFTFLVVERRHAAAGLVMQDLFRDEEIWLKDEGLEATARQGAVLASRVVQHDLFHMTTGAAVPMSRLALVALQAALPFPKGDPELARCTDVTFITAIFRLAVSRGLMRKVILD